MRSIVWLTLLLCSCTSLEVPRFAPTHEFSFDTVYVASPDSPGDSTRRVQFTTGRVFYAHGGYSKAMTPDTVFIHYSYVDLLRGLSRYARAAIGIEEVLGLDPIKRDSLVMAKHWNPIYLEPYRPDPHYDARIQESE